MGRSICDTEGFIIRDGVLLKYDGVEEGEYHIYESAAPFFQIELVKVGM